MHHKVAILGSSGSIGQSTKEVARNLNLEVVALAVHSNIESLEKDLTFFSPKIVGIFNEEKAKVFAKKYPSIKVVTGIEGLIEIATMEESSFVMQAMSGSDGLAPTIEALKAGKRVGLANKEVLVMAGELIQHILQNSKGTIIPVDSEHSAIFQCIDGHDLQELHRIVLTASGGPFLRRDPSTFAQITVQDALAHPSWKMGKKVTIDCSTLMNKGLEVIEAHFLFNIPPEKIDVVIHPQSMVHSFVEWKDGSTMAQVAYPDMKLPIQYALTYPKREKASIPFMDFTKRQRWEFLPPDKKSFPCLDLAYKSLNKKQSFPCFLNACNEILVEKFLQQEISWRSISDKLAQLISFHRGEDLLTLEAIKRVDVHAREMAGKV